MTFVLTLEDPRHFAKSRQVGPALGLVPRRDQSGDHEPLLRITKCGDAYLRQFLVNCAHYILGPFGPDCELRSWGLKLAERGGKNAKKRAVIAVARKLASCCTIFGGPETPMTPSFNPQYRTNSEEHSSRGIFNQDKSERIIWRLSAANAVFG